MSSYRTELAGILAALYCLNALCDYTKKQVLAQLPLYCDNAAAVLTAKSSTSPDLKAHVCADYDISAEVRTERTNITNLSVSWVKAHQDKKKPFVELTLDVKLNCTADKDAEFFQLNASADLQPTLVPPELPLTKTYLVINGTVITNNLRQQPEENYKTISIKKYIKKKTSLSDDDVENVDWTALGKTLTNNIYSTKYD
eukprot:3884876-Ditylum_brightwellii.AAC.1